MPIHKRTGVLWRSRRVESGQANGGQADSTIDDCDFDAKQWLSRHLMDSVQRTKTFDSAQWADDKALKALETIMGRPVISRLLNRVHHSALDLDELVDDLVSFAEKTFFPGENVIYDDGDDCVPDGKSNCVVHSSIASSRFNITMDGSDLVGVSARCLRRCHPLSTNDVRQLVLLTCSRQTATNNKKGAAKSEAKKDTWLVDDEQKEKFGIHDRLAPIFCKAQRTDQDMASTPSAQPKKEEVKKREKKKKVAEQKKKQNGEGAEKRRLSDKENGREEEAGEEAENTKEPAAKKARKKAVKEEQKETAEMKNGREKKKETKRMSGGAEPEVIVVEDGKEQEKGKGNGEEPIKKAKKKAAKEERLMEDNNQDAKSKKTGKKETAGKENGKEKKKEKKRLSGEAEAEVVIVEDEEEEGEEEKGQGEKKSNGKSKKKRGEKMEENGKTEEKTPKKQKQSTLSAFVQRVAAPSTGSSSSKEKEDKREDKMRKLIEKLRKASQSEDPKALSTQLMSVYKTVSLAEITAREKQLEVDREKKTLESEKDRSHQELLILQVIRAYKMSDEKKQQLTRESNEKDKAQIQEELEQWKKLKKILRKKITKKKEDEHQEEQSNERIHTTPLQLAGAVALTSPFFPEALMISQFLLAHRAHLHVPRLYHIPQAGKLLLAIDSPALSDTVLLPLVIGMLKAISKSPEYETIVSCQQCIGLLEVNQFTWLEILLAVIRGERAMTRREKEKEEQKMGIHRDARDSRSATREGSVVPVENQDEEEVDDEEALDDAFIDTDTRRRLLSSLEDADGRSFGNLPSDVQMSILVLLVNRVLDCLPVTASKTSDKKKELVKLRQELAEKLRPLKTQRDAGREECARLEKAGRALTRYLSAKLSNLEHACLSTEEKLQSVIDQINELNQKASQTCRVSCLGVDRHGRRFYVFPESASGLFMHDTEFYEWHVDEDGTAQPELIHDEEAFECISSEGDILRAVKLLEKGTKSEMRLAKAIQLQLSAGAFQPPKEAIDGEKEGEETKAAETVSDSKWWIQHTKQELINLATELDKKQFLGRQNSEPLPETFLDDISEKKSISELKEVAVRLARSIGCVSGPFRVFDPNFPCPFSPNTMVNDIEDADKGSVLYFLIQVFRSRVQWEFTKKKMARSEEREDEEEKDELTRKLRPRGRVGEAPNSAEDNEEITKMIERIQQGRLYKTLRGLEVDGVWRLEDLFDKAQEMPVQRFKRRLGKMMLAWREHFEEFLPRKLEQFNELEEELDL